MNQRERMELDRHITGNYGEDQIAAQEGKRTPGPWETSATGDGLWDICAVDAGDMIADLAGCENAEANAQFIIRACNSHDKLLGLLRMALRVLPAGVIYENIADDEPSGTGIELDYEIRTAIANVEAA